MMAKSKVLFLKKKEEVNWNTVCEISTVTYTELRKPLPAFLVLLWNVGPPHHFPWKLVSPPPVIFLASSGRLLLMCRLNTSVW